MSYMIEKMLKAIRDRKNADQIASKEIVELHNTINALKKERELWLAENIKSRHRIVTLMSEKSILKREIEVLRSKERI